MPLNLDLQLGTSFDWQLQIRNADDSIPTNQFLITDALAAKLWQGSSKLPLVTWAPTWLSAPNAQYVIPIQNADTAGLAQGIYYVEATATRAGRTVALMPKGSTITLTPTPGTTAARASYIDARDLRRVAGWIDQINAPNNDTGFLEQCADARDWLDEAILRQYGGGTVSALGGHGAALDAWYGTGSQSSARSPWLLGTLNAGPAAVGNMVGGLIVTSRTRDMCAHYAVHRICQAMLLRSGAATQYLGLSAINQAEAQRLLACYTAEINVGGVVDYNGNLVASVPINFSSTATIWA